MLTETGLPPERLELEVTESVSLHEGPGTRQTLDSLRTLGVGLAIDDFGTGYSALGRLHSLPFDRLKIDKVFIDEHAAGSTQPTLVQSILDMASVLHLKVVAEGVEDAGASGPPLAAGLRRSAGIPFQPSSRPHGPGRVVEAEASWKTSLVR